MDANHSLTDEQRMIARSIDQIAKRYDRQYWLDKARKLEFPQEMWDEIAATGLFGMIIPEEYGGSGMKIDDLRVAIEELSRRGLSTLHFISFFMDCIFLVRHASPEQKERWLPEMVNGTYFSFAITEPDAGTNTFKIKTRAVREGDHYRLNGQKHFITGAADSKYMVLIARTTPYEAVQNKRDGLSIFVIDPKSEGITMQPQNVGILSPDRQYVVFFDDVTVPIENRIGDEGRGISYLFSGLNLERIIVASYALGWGKFALGKGVDYAKQRVLFEVPIGAHQGLQHQLSRAHVNLELATLSNERAARAYDADEDGKVVGLYANMAKLAASEAAFQACDTAIQVHGGSGMTEDSDLINLLPLIRAMRVAPINNEMVLNYIGEHQLGLPRSY